MNKDGLPTESIAPDIANERVRSGLTISTLATAILIIGAKPEWLGLDISPVIGFVQITVILIGLAILCLGGYIGVAALWGNREKSIIADIGTRLIGTGYVITVFTGMADVFGLSVQENIQVPFFGPWQSAGMQIGMSIIAAGMLMLIPYGNLLKKQ